MFAISADFNSQTLSYGYKGALFSSFLKLLNDVSQFSLCPVGNTKKFKVVLSTLLGLQIISKPHFLKHLYNWSQNWQWDSVC